MPPRAPLVVDALLRGLAVLLAAPHAASGKRREEPPAERPTLEAERPQPEVLWGACCHQRRQSGASTGRRKGRRGATRRTTRRRRAGLADHVVSGAGSA